MSKAITADFVNMTRERAMLEFQHGVLAAREAGMGIIEAINAYIEYIGIEPEEAVSLISPKLTVMITKEAKSLNLLKK